MGHAPVPDKTNCLREEAIKVTHTLRHHFPVQHCWSARLIASVGSLSRSTCDCSPRLPFVATAWEESIEVNSWLHDDRTGSTTPWSTSPGGYGSRRQRYPAGRETPFLYFSTSLRRGSQYNPSCRRRLVRPRMRWSCPLGRTPSSRRERNACVSLSLFPWPAVQ